MAVIPVVLGGGVGTRLWPLSRASRPKQFLSFDGTHSLFQNTILRCRGAVFDPRPIVVGAESNRFLLADDLSQIGAEAEIVLEPVARNSCAAAVAGCLRALERSADAMVLILAADHHIPDADAFALSVEDALGDASGGSLLTFGIMPDRPATAYGYILPGERLDKAWRVARFVEKPAPDLAASYLRQGYLWNSGNFLCRADLLLAEVERFQPAILTAVRRAHETARREPGGLRLGAAAYARSPAISIDYAVMERTERAAVMKVAYGWSDVGTWDAVGDLVAGDRNRNAVVGDGMVVEGRGNLVHSEGRLTTVIGADALVVVATRDCVLVVPKSRAGEVKKLVGRLQRRARLEATEGQQSFRPWGSFERLDLGEGYQVKRIEVKPGGILSLQKHRHRAEHWVVVGGLAEVTVDGVTGTVPPGQSIHVPLGATHRLANHGSEPVVLIEVQTGAYLGEDDIVRLDDVYDRQAEPGKRACRARLVPPAGRG